MSCAANFHFQFVTNDLQNGETLTNEPATLGPSHIALEGPERRNGQRDKCSCSQTQQLTMVPNAMICVVAKCPIAGKSKTRLATGLTDEGCAAMAKAMLSDVLTTLHTSKSLSPVVKVLYHAPADADGARLMGSILDELGIPYRIAGNSSGSECSECGEAGTNTNQTQNDPESTSTAKPQTTWYLCPMPDAHNSNLQSSDLGSKLAGMLVQTRTMVQKEFSGQDDTPQQAPAVAFLGMDAPELPVEEIAYALELASGQQQLEEESAIDHNNNNNNNNSNRGTAYINPSHDGGYGMLCLPPQASPGVFEGVRWSDPLTAVSQIKALTDEGMAVTVGSLMRDIDTMEDLLGLAERLRLARSRSRKHDEGSGENKNGRGGTSLDDKLLRPPPGRGIDRVGYDNDNTCQYSWEAIQQLKIGC